VSVVVQVTVTCDSCGTEYERQFDPLIPLRGVRVALRQDGWRLCRNGKGFDDLCPACYKKRARRTRRVTRLPR